MNLFKHCPCPQNRPFPVEFILRNAIATEKSNGPGGKLVKKITN